MLGASVLWNGTIHNTTFIDPQHVSVAIGASDVETSASVNLTCRNPESIDSNTTTVTVQ
jgi:trimeric autotransporter adhesin